MPDLSVAVDERVFAAHPGYVAAVVVAEGLGNGPSDDDSSARLAEAEASLLARGLERAADDPHIAEWRAAFSRFGAKPKRYPCSAEALAARVIKGGSLPRINVLVDLYNAVSVRHLIPVGGEDLDRLEGPLRLTIADGERGVRRRRRRAAARRGRLARRRRRDLPALELAPGHADAADRDVHARVLRVRPAPGAADGGAGPGDGGARGGVDGAVAGGCDAPDRARR